MRRKISLYIDGQLTDLDEQSFILFNYTRDEADNPTIVKNSYSQQLTLPGSPKNNEIFGNYFRPERITDTGFNSLVKTPFAIYNDLNEIIESGYVRLDKVNRKGGGLCSYTITLFGGLGGFFYDLMYNADGSKKTLADLSYSIEGVVTPAAAFPMTLTRTQVARAWSVLAGDVTDDLYAQFNFAPAYNGIPENFSADKAVYHPGASETAQIKGIYSSATKDGKTYTTKGGAGGYLLLSLEHPHTEWEVQDLRSYLQRPVVNLLRLMQTIALPANTGDYTLDLESTFFTASNALMGGAWMTLPMFDYKTLSPASFTLADLLKGTHSPAEYLIGVAKLFGMVFRYDYATKTIHLEQRDTFYTGSDVDLSRRLDTDVEIVPNVMDAQHYIWQYPQVFGQFAQEYLDTYGKVYGSQWVDTGYDFNADRRNVLEGIPFNGAPDVMEASGLFQVFRGDSDTGGTGSYKNYWLKFIFSEEVKWQLYGTDDEGREISQDFSVTKVPWLSPMRYSIGTDNYTDFMVKVQLHGADNKAETGDNVLLFFEGMVETPHTTAGGYTIQEAVFHLSDDVAPMLLLNEGKPCWDVSVTGSNILDVASLPQFRRFHYEGGTLTDSFELGVPLEVAVSDFPSETQRCLYTDFWDIYIADRFDKDTKKVSVKVDFGGLQVSQALLQNFYWFDNSLWVLNKIINYSLTTYDPVECEFVQVQSKDNYQDGQE